MIDEKKITEAVNAYIGYPKELGEGIETSMRRDAFRDGVEWFKEAIWHKREEEPTEEGLIVVVRIIDGKQVATIDNWVKHKNEAIAEALNEGFQQSEIDKFFLTEWAERGNFDKWCYLADLLPKGGEE